MKQMNFMGSKSRAAKVGEEYKKKWGEGSFSVQSFSTSAIRSLCPQSVVRFQAGVCFLGWGGGGRGNVSNV